MRNEQNIRNLGQRYTDLSNSIDQRKKSSLPILGSIAELIALSQIPIGAAITLCGGLGTFGTSEAQRTGSFFGGLLYTGVSLLAFGGIAHLNGRREKSIERDQLELETIRRELPRDFWPPSEPGDTGY